MAWSHFIPSSSTPANSDRALNSSIYSLNAADNHRSRSIASDELLLLRSLYAGGDNSAAVAAQPPPADGIAGGQRCPAGEGSAFQEVTLEDYLTRTGRVRAGEGKGPPEAPGRFVGQRPGGQLAVEDGDQIGGVAAGGGRGRGRGRKRVMVDQPDRTASQRQKRMIKNRESAARSRERRQQYTNQLEQTVFKLEEENAKLLKERDKLANWRFKELAERVIPLMEKKKRQPALRRTNSFP
ncbi:G-box-binding factor 4 [Apostasia shenzhenica]|uniref:G-box-binding factor 4 n=1 Tax=Apostasia shenzhenica TaxID=1088818 RepID=A0A2H9ZUP0_9ASPA|nr:G-box-binding factor 4 [Apostasia shenzhenica]